MTAPEQGRRYRLAAAAATTRATDTGAAAIDILIGVATLLMIAVGAVAVAIPVFGWSTRVSTPMAAISAILTVVVAGLVANRKKLSFIPSWVFLILPIGIVAGIVVAYALRDSSDGTNCSGELTAKKQEASCDVAISAGDRIVATLDPSSELKANLIVQHGAIRLYGAPTPDGALVVDATEPGGIWHAVVRAVGASTGTYSVNVSTDPGEPIEVGDKIAADQLTDGADSNGHVFSLHRPETLYIEVEPVDPTDLNLNISVYKANGFAAALLRHVKNEWSTYRRFAAGTYIIVVRSADRSSGGDYSLSLTRDAPLGARPEVIIAASHRVRVPNIVGRSEVDAQSELVRAGLAPRLVPVCSSAARKNTATQVVRVTDGHEIVIADSNGKRVDQLPAQTEVVVKVATGSACNAP